MIFYIMVFIFFYDRKGLSMIFVDYLLAHNRYCSIFGIFFLFFLCWLLSYKRSAIKLRPVLAGFVLQVLIGFFVLKTELGYRLLAGLVGIVDLLYQATEQGSRFIFGNLCDYTGPWGFIFAIRVLPVIVFFSAFTALLFYFGIIQRCVRGINYLLQPLIGTTGPETACAIANSFLGQTEAPLVIRHYLGKMTESELFVVMVSGMATISGAILVVFVAMGIPATHLLASSAMSIPGALVIAKIVYPETEKSIYAQESMDGNDKKDDDTIDDTIVLGSSVFEVIAKGTSDGLHMALIIGAMLIVFLAFLNSINGVLSWMAAFFLGAAYSVSLEKIVGFICAPCGYMLGFVGDEAFRIGELIGIKIAVNELVAYNQLLSLHLSQRATALTTYALCGFSNFSCIGIQVGGIGLLVPEKRHIIAKLGIYAVFAGALTNFLSALIINLLI